MDTIELSLTLNKEHCEAILAVLESLADNMAAILADKVADKERESTKEKETTNTITYAEDATTLPDTNTCISSVITGLASNMVLDTNTYKATDTDKLLNTDKATLPRNSTMHTKENNNIVLDACMHSNINTNADTNYGVNKESPTLEEIVSYVNACGYNMSPKKFYDYYKRNGWINKNKVDIRAHWREFVDQWAKYEYKKPTTKGNQAGMGTVEERRAAHPFVPSFDV